MKTKQLKRLGNDIVKLLMLKPVRDESGDYFNPHRYNTTWGTKSAVGIAVSIHRLTEGAEEVKS